MSNLGQRERQIAMHLEPFKSMDAAHAKALLETAELLVLNPGQPLLQIGDVSLNCYFLLSGSLLLSQGEQQELIHAESEFASRALRFDAPLSQSVVADQLSYLFSIPATRLSERLCWDQVVAYIILQISASRDRDDDAEWMMTLLESNLFYKVSPVNIERVFDRFTAETVHAGDVVIRQGEVGDCLFILKEGHAEVCRADSDKQESQVIAELLPGRCFGEDALVNETVRNATVRMLSDGQLMRLSKRDFYSLLAAPKVDKLAINDLHNLPSYRIIDVRTADEYANDPLIKDTKGYVVENMPLGQLPLRLRQGAADQTLCCICDDGRRSERAAYLLAAEGYKAVALTLS